MKGTIITVTSGKGGVGKTTVTANLATALAQKGKRVACIDGDIGMRKLDAVLGLTRLIRYDLADVVNGRARLKHALIKDFRLPKLALLPAPKIFTQDTITEYQMVTLCQELQEVFDFVLIDCPAGIESGFRNAITPADEIIVVVTLDVGSVRGGDCVVGLLEEVKKPSPRLVINRYRPALTQKGGMLDIPNVLDILAIELLGIVPEEANIIAAGHRGKPLTLESKSPAVAAFTRIARRLLGENIPIQDFFAQPNILERLSMYLVYQEMKKLVSG